MGCRRQATQAALDRIARTADGRLVRSRSAPGRGAWLCAGSRACLEQAIRRKAFARAFRASVAEDATTILLQTFEADTENVRDLSAARDGVLERRPATDSPTKG